MIGRARILGSRGLPRPFVRLTRNHASLMATFLAVVVAVASASVSDGAALRITSEVNGHWRGAYDILVRAPGARLDLEATNGLVEPNFLAFSGSGGIALADLEAIRRLADVDVAAPAAFIGYVRTDSVAPVITISSLPARPTLYEVELEAATSDGVSARLMFKDKFRILVGPPREPGGQPVVLTEYGEVTSSTNPDGGLVVYLNSTHFLPAAVSPVLAVDPQAEHRLLGEAGAFLAPLEALSGRSLTAGTMDSRLIPPAFFSTSALVTRLGMQPDTTDRPVFPILASARGYASVLLSLDVSQVGAPISGAFDAQTDAASALEAAAAQAGPGFVHVGRVATDQSARMTPFGMASLGIAWPGSSPGTQFSGMRPSAFDAMLAARPTYAETSPPSGSGPAFTIRAQGAVDMGGTVHGPAGTSISGSEEAYRHLVEMTSPLVQQLPSATANNPPFVLAPVGTFDLGNLVLPDDPLTYVPLGAYDSPDTVLVADPDGKSVAPKSMRPTLNAEGFLQVPPLAIADLRAAEMLRGPKPIDAIRVRVAGLSDYGVDARSKVEHVAAAITALGLDVDIVAGSSPQAVSVFVPSYDTSTDPPSDLGWVEQHWTTLGAASRVERGLSEANSLLLLLALASIAFVVIGLQVLFIDIRRRDDAVFAAVGWSRLRRVRWQLEESLVSAGLVALVGIAAWWVMGKNPASLAEILVIAGCFPIASLVASFAAGPNPQARRRHRRDRVLRRLPVQTISSYALRSVAARPARSAIFVLGFALAASTTAPALMLVVTTGARVGPTRLAGALGSTLQPYQFILLGLAAAAAVGFCLVALRAEGRDRADELRALAAVGWQPAQVASLMRRERIVLALPSAIIAFGIAFATAEAIAGASALASATVAATLSLSVIIWGGFSSRPHTAALSAALTVWRWRRP